MLSELHNRRFSSGATGAWIWGVSVSQHGVQAVSTTWWLEVGLAAEVTEGGGRRFQPRALACRTISTSTARVSCGVATSWRKLMRAPLTPLVVFNLSEKPKRSTDVIVASVASIPACDPASRIIAST